MLNTPKDSSLWDKIAAAMQSLGFLLGLSLEMWFGIVSLLVGLAASAYFYRKGKREKAPRYVASSVTLISAVGSKVSDVEVRYKGEVIENLRSATVTIWNAGRDPIRRQDVASDAPVTIQLPEGNRLLSATVERMANPLNRFEVKTVSRRKAVLDFEFFGENEGVVVKLLYAGEVDAPEVTGHVIGSGDIPPAIVTTKARDVMKVAGGVVAPPALSMGWLVLILPALDRWTNASLLAGLLKLTIALGGSMLVAVGAMFFATQFLDRPLESPPPALATGVSPHARPSG